MVCEVERLPIVVKHMGVVVAPGRKREHDPGLPRGCGKKERRGREARARAPEKNAEKLAAAAASGTVAEGASDRSDTTTADQSEDEVVDLTIDVPAKKKIQREKMKKKNRNLTSAVWSCFEDAPVNSKTGHRMAKCAVPVDGKKCGALTAVNSSTSGMWSHLQLQHSAVWASLKQTSGAQQA